jgi:hypothetical protein
MSVMKTDYTPIGGEPSTTGANRNKFFVMSEHAAIQEFTAAGPAGQTCRPAQFDFES